MKISKWSFAGAFAGIIFSLYSGLRYFVLFPDMDRAIVYVLVGVLSVGLSWAYNEILKHSNVLSLVEERVQDLSTIHEKELKELSEWRENHGITN